MDKLSIMEIKMLLQENELNHTQLANLKSDKRKGVQQLLRLHDKKLQREYQKREQFRLKQNFDRGFCRNGDWLLAGVDEAGRGPLAGPVVAAAVMLPSDFYLPGLTDSKQLSQPARETFYTYIKEHAVSFHIEVISPEMIDRVNIFQATKSAMTKALNQLKPQPHIGLIDAIVLSELPFHTASLIKGDSKSLSIAAASVLAKVTRDNIMEEIHKQYPQYEFIQNKGYGTKKHLAAIMKYGPCEHHRKSFAPINSMV